jgi:alcohol dehydrogenase (cytochrome c)
MGVNLNLAVRSGLSDGDIYRAITRGRGSEMPVITTNIQEALKITAYVRYLGERKGDEAASTPSRPCPDLNVSSSDIEKNFSDSKGWLSYSGDYTGQRFAPYTQINKNNVSKLRTRFVYQTRSAVGLEAVPIVANGVLLFTGTDNQVVAIDLATGDLLWEHRRPVAEGTLLCCGRRNRGVAVLGNRVFHNTLDGRLVAIDIRNGKELWNIEVVNYREGYSITGAPLAIKDAVIVGVSGGDFGAPGVIDAYDPATGARLWRFDAIPGPGQPGHDTWKNDSWKQGGGATWVTGTYDPKLDLVYWGIGNPAKIFNPASRPGDNLYTSSVVALEGRSGKLRWHYQFTPNDGNDWDATSTPVLVDREVGGVSRKLMLFANRNCFFYAIDRETGKFLSAHAYCEQNWNDGFTQEGRPIRRPASISGPNGPFVTPGALGGANWMQPAYDSGNNIFIVKNYVGGNRFYSEETDDPAGGRIEKPHNVSMDTNVTALSSPGGAVLWQVTEPGENHSGLLATAGGLVFTGDTAGWLSALDITSGQELWRYRLGGQITMAPITYFYNKNQEIAIISGGALFVLGLP